MPLSATPSHLGFTRRLFELLHLLVVIVDERLLYLDRGIQDRGRCEMQVGR
jgi:hypothetical protein